MFRRPSSLVYFGGLLGVTILAMNAGSLAQTGTAAAKAAEKQALHRGQEALKNGDIAGARAEFEKAERLSPPSGSFRR